ncbi:sensor histidine kinase [Streptomyces sp. MUM 203J]|uniref:sensor histidine kinase n=1 Tax=Streptomyces sp. MUM 203J TaxID=2791990 RepID=UPI0035AB928B
MHRRDGTPAESGFLPSGAGPSSSGPAAPALAPVTTLSLPVQVNALSALCRQLYGFRFAMTALATPFALAGARGELSRWLAGSAVLVTVMVSYALLRDWERFGPVLLRHPTLLAADMLFGALLLFTASPDSTLAYVTICTPLLAGLVYGWRGATVFVPLQSLLVGLAYAVDGEVEADVSALLVVGLCVIAGAVGTSLRRLLLGFGAAGQALTEARARLAAHEAVEGERARLAREMHDSVAKTLHGVALAADGLARSADRMDPAAVREGAALVARSARRAAAESRELLADLRREPGQPGGVDLASELASRTADFARRTGLQATYRSMPRADTPPPVPYAAARQLLAIASEAMENAHRHARPTRVAVAAGVEGDLLRVSVYDDGRGLPSDIALEDLRRSGHFGMVGMVERAAGVGARIRIGRGGAARGTEVRLDLPLAALRPGSAASSAGAHDAPVPRRGGRTCRIRP